MDEKTSKLPNATVTWATAASVPAVTQIELPMKNVVKLIMVEIDGTWDQSVGAETQATEGCVALVDEIRLNLGGTLRRQFKGGALFELNRLKQGAANPQTDPATGTGTGKAFASVFFFDLGLFDTKEEFNKKRGDIQHVQAQTLLDLRNFGGKNYLEIVWKPFNSYASGNTQANMTATVKATVRALLGYPRIVTQRHTELVLVDTVDMSATKTDAYSPLLRDGVYSRGVLVRVGTLSATPIVLADTALSGIKLEGTFKSGPAIQYRDKLAPATLRRYAGWDRPAQPVLRAGYSWLDHSGDQSFGGGVDGNKLAAYQATYDITGTASTFMQVFQLVVRQ